MQVASDTGVIPPHPEWDAHNLRPGHCEVCDYIRYDDHGGRCPECGHDPMVRQPAPSSGRVNAVVGVCFVVMVTLPLALASGPVVLRLLAFGLPFLMFIAMCALVFAVLCVPLIIQLNHRASWHAVEILGVASSFCIWELFAYTSGSIYHPDLEALVALVPVVSLMAAVRAVVKNPSWEIIILFQFVLFCLTVFLCVVI